MVARVSERVWRATAMVLCAAVPGSFYLLGDLTDAFPGVLTLETSQEGPGTGPAAQAEDWERVSADAPSPAVAPSPDPEAAADLEQRMSAHAEDPVVAGGLAFSVTDAETGETIAARDADTARIPASTLKLLTAAAVLRVYDGDEVLTTRAVVTEGTITLQGGGDMTLTDADLRDLAGQAAALAREQGTEQVTVNLDDNYLTGGRNPAWGNNGPSGGWVTPTATLALDEGWLDGEQYGPKSTDPAGDAALRFSELLGEEGIEVDGEITAADAPADAPSVEVHSEPLSQIVRHTLQISDNTTAELLAHLVADARGEETTPEGAAAAVEAEIRDLAAELGVPDEDLDALDIRDGSGLSRQNRVPPALLAAVLGETASGDVPTLEQLLFDVPIAGLSGTLADRFDADSARDADGLVRGKTGYLGGAATLAGVVALPDGRAAGYSIVVHGFDGADAAAARAAVDDIAAEMVRAD
ncbi:MULTISPECIES: D-alanyl-D-alanine carboxypeptidase/D-alanyl-D-alanine-endopeptidase [unclassified Brachybacterium]|uniref:D-alanyl-D-alanine carboxypeptidase/D-alanyl-D-alanine-endopeptidase n=1 Tax=unclassified Brachybacterium TaxID=2623841 RepID=UPI00360FC55F